jgi:5-methylcytosine-specific restriction protein A
MAKPPNWTRDELILALDLFFRVNPIHTTEEHPEIIKLSRVLNELPIHQKQDIGVQFRNPNGVYMKLCNYLRFDPNYNGVGLKRGGKLEEVVWKDFSKDKVRLTEVSKSIVNGLKFLSDKNDQDLIKHDDEEEFSEGKILTVIHKRRERNKSVVEKKKKLVLENNGKLDCEVCGFNFEKVYGNIGRDFAECHHTKPLSQLTESSSTKINDLAIICSNCHRMIHRTSPMQSILEFKKSLLQSENIK